MESQELKLIFSELTKAVALIDDKELEHFSNCILAANRLFIAGAGRSGFIARAFSNRLMHLGLDVYFVGEPTTPAIKKGDLLIISSGSGTTAGLVVMAKKAISSGAKVTTITTAPEHTIGNQSEAIITLPGTTRLAQDNPKTIQSSQPVGNLFEQLSWLTCDSLIIKLKNKLSLSNDDLINHHANLE